MKILLALLFISSSAFAERLICQNTETSSTLDILFYIDGEIGDYEGVPLRNIELYRAKDQVTLRMDNWAGFYQLTYSQAAFNSGKKFTAELKVTRHEDSWYWVDCVTTPN